MLPAASRVTPEDGNNPSGPARADFLGRAARVVHGLDAVRPASALPVPAGLGHSGHDRHVHGHVRVHLRRFPRHASGSAVIVHPFIPQISLITAWMLVALSFGFLVYYSHRVAKSIRPAH